MTPITSSPEKAMRPADQGAGVSRYAVFRRQQQYFGVTIDLVREVLPGQSLTRVARAREEILGVLSLRGEILPVVVIDHWLGLTVGADDPSLPILVLRRGDLLVGLRVDAIQSVVNISEAEIQPHPAETEETLLTGIWSRPNQPPITLIDGTALLTALCQQTSTNS